MKCEHRYISGAVCKETFPHYHQVSTHASAESVIHEHADYTPCWCNQWIPPTDEERAMFREAANASKNPGFDHWYINECNTIGNAAHLALSLSMDGL